MGIAGIKVGSCSRSGEQQPCVGGGNCSVRYVTFGKNYIGLCERVIVAGRDGADEFLTSTFLFLSSSPIISVLKYITRLETTSQSCRFKVFFT